MTLLHYSTQASVTTGDKTAAQHSKHKQGILFCKCKTNPREREVMQTAEIPFLVLLLLYTELLLVGSTHPAQASLGAVQVTSHSEEEDVEDEVLQG